MIYSLNPCIENIKGGHRGKEMEDPIHSNEKILTQGWGIHSILKVGLSIVINTMKTTGSLSLFYYPSLPGLLPLTMKDQIQLLLYYQLNLSFL